MPKAIDVRERVFDIICNALCVDEDPESALENADLMEYDYIAEEISIDFDIDFEFTSKISFEEIVEAVEKQLE